MSEKAQGRVFPPLYKSSGDPASDRLAFFHVLERLKVCSVHYSATLILSRIADTEANRMGR
jgi:hypothetical protein